jgi:hypothetical protein
MRWRCLVALVPVLVAAQARADEPASLTVEGYCDRLSYQPGETIAFHVSTTAPQYALEIARLGDRTDVVLTRSGLAGTAHPIPEDASSHGCGWPASFRLEVPPDWRPGYYNARLRVADSGGKYVGRNRWTAEVDLSFIVGSAHPGEGAKVPLQLSTNTCSAYNSVRDDPARGRCHRGRPLDRIRVDGDGYGTSRAAFRPSFIF